MITLVNTELPMKKNFKSSLQSIYGIGLYRAQRLIYFLGIHANTRIEHMYNLEIDRLSTFIERSFVLDFELRHLVELNINKLIDLKTFRGFRHYLGLPTRGQRTHTNAATAKRLLRSSKVIISKIHSGRGVPKRNLKNKRN